MIFFEFFHIVDKKLIGMYSNNIFQYLYFGAPDRYNASYFYNLVFPGGVKQNNNLLRLNKLPGPLPT